MARALFTTLDPACLRRLAFRLAFDSLAKLAPGTLGGHPDVRLKAEAGVTLGIVGGPKLQALGGVEEGGGGTPDAWTGRLLLNLPLK